MSDSNAKRPNVEAVYSISELADLFGLTYNEVDSLMGKQLLTAVHIDQWTKWGDPNKPRYYLPLTPQNEAILEWREINKRCYRYTKALEAIVSEQVTDGEAMLAELKEKHEINTAGDLFGFTTYG